MKVALDLGTGGGIVGNCGVFLGCVERDTGKCFMKQVPNRTKPTLKRETVGHILPSTHILSDGWASYEDIPFLQGGIYTLDTIIHEENLDDPECHIQTVESL